MHRSVITKFSLASMCLLVAIACVQIRGQAGSFDTGFSEDGVFTLDSQGLSMAWDQVVQSDGKVVTLSHGMVNGIYRNRLVRNNTDGSLDDTFDGDGVLDFSWGDSTYTSPRAFSVGIQRIADEDRIVVAGFDTVGSGRKVSSALRIDRFMLDGDADYTFGSGGSFLTSAVGNSYKLTVRPTDNAILNYTDPRKIVCIEANGGFCSGFGVGGVITLNGDGVGQRGLVLDQAERVLVLTYVSTGKGKSAVSGPVVTRYNRNGQIDTSFGINGSRMFGNWATEHAHELDIDPFGNIIAAGTKLVGDNWDLAVYRLTPNGSVDASFNGTGRATFDFAGFEDLQCDVAVQSNGQILVGGLANYSDVIADTDFAVVRFNGDGSVDSSFGTGGAFVWNNGSSDVVREVTVHSSGDVDRIFIAGTANPNLVVASINAL